MNPFDILASWQAAVIGTIVYCLTQGIKTAIDLWLSNTSGWFRKPGARQVAQSLGAAERKTSHPILHRLVLPAVPVWLGIIAAVVVPVRPDSVVKFAANYTAVEALIIYGAWGAFVGQFASYSYDRISSFFKSGRQG